MNNKLILLLFLLCIRFGFTQQYSGLFVHVEYQVLKYNYLQFGIGHHLKNNLIQAKRDNEQYYFSGYTISYSKSINNSDWGLVAQYIAYSGTYSGPIALGIEMNYKSVNTANHYGIKPIIGLSFPIWSVTYGYNFDLYGNKEERISQHELIVGLRLRVLKWK